MDCFIKKIWDGKAEEAHAYFTRFSKGTFENRALINLQKISKIKLKGGFEWTNDFVSLVCEIGGGKVSGMVLSKEDLSGIMSKNLIKGNSVEKRGGLFFQNNLDEQEISGEKLRELIEEAYATMLDIEGEGFILKIKKKLPKPGNNKEGKVDDKFCVLEADLKYWQIVSKGFMLPECRKAKVSHTFEITEIITPDAGGEKDFAKIREMAKRKGKIIRKIIADGQEREEVREFEA